MACSHCGSRASEHHFALFLKHLKEYEVMYIKIRRTKPSWGLITGHVYKHSQIKSNILQMGLKLKYFRETTLEEYLKYNPKKSKPKTKKLTQNDDLTIDSEKQTEEVKQLLKDIFKENEDKKLIEEEDTIRKKPKRIYKPKRNIEPESSIEGTD